MADLILSRTWNWVYFRVDDRIDVTTGGNPNRVWSRIPDRALRIADGLRATRRFWEAING